MIREQTIALRKGDVLEISEFHDGRYGKPGEKRQPKKKATKEQIERHNARLRTDKCRRRLIEYFTRNDLFITLTYAPENRPKDMKAAKKDFQAFIRSVKILFTKRHRELFWIRNIEKGTKGAWHCHLVINEIGDTASIVKKHWNHGGVYVKEIEDSYEDMARLADYMTKDQNTQEKNKDGTIAKPRIKEASESHSRNMPLPEPESRKYKRWKKEIKPKSGYYIAGQYEGVNPKTGYLYRRYVLIRLNRRP